MSAGFTGVWRTVRDLADRQKKEEALAAMRRAYEAGTIHEYEIDVMMDQLGWCTDEDGRTDAAPGSHVGHPRDGAHESIEQ